MTTVTAGAALFGPAGLFTTHRHAILVGLTVAVAVVLALVGAQAFSRAVGWKRAVAWLARSLRGAVVGLAAAAWRPARYWLRVRFAAAALLDAEVPALRDRSFAAVAGARTPGRAYLLAAGPAQVTVGATLRPARPGPGAAARGHDDPSSRDARRGLGSPWRPAGPGRWTAGRAELLATGRGVPDEPAPGVLVAVGVSGRGRQRALVLLDLAALPAVGAIEGPPEAGRRLAAMIAAQLAAGLPATGRPARLVVTDDVLPGYGGPTLAVALGELPSTSTGAGPRPETDTPSRSSLIVLVCARPDDAEAGLLAAAARRDPAVRVLVAGAWSGAGFRLVLDDVGGLTAPEFGITVDSAPLERAVARVLRPAAVRRRAMTTAAPARKTTTEPGPAPLGQVPPGSWTPPAGEQAPAAPLHAPSPPAWAGPVPAPSVPHSWPAPTGSPVPMPPLPMPPFPGPPQAPAAGRAPGAWPAPVPAPSAPPGPFHAPPPMSRPAAAAPAVPAAPAAPPVPPGPFRAPSPSTSPPPVAAPAVPAATPDPRHYAPPGSGTARPGRDRGVAVPVDASDFAEPDATPDAADPAITTATAASATPPVREAAR
ncbi:hypothetical protein [Pseudofrankia sp. BMG5.37]|uniref:hypothetical protein n=1 Tax=Pseudofrankia sp. BMG5.37 TaxID=3050035 RepID=UPI0028944147|nr:hypothetical protein [Pseudofrankia sp. BMG5.37]MDT3440636.1 hypothetical protein [Pseudofrankia sp. BMG5.37]